MIWGDTALQSWTNFRYQNSPLCHTGNLHQFEFYKIYKYMDLAWNYVIINYVQCDTDHIIYLENRAITNFAPNQILS